LDIENSSIELKYLKCELIIAETVKEKGERKMKTKLYAVAFVALLALSMFAVLPAFSWEPPEPGKEPCVLYIDPQEKKFTGPCCDTREFEAEVKIYNVKDLFAWELAVVWDPTYLNLTDYVIKVPPGWKDTDYLIGFEDLEHDATWARLHWAVVGLKDKATNFTGSCALLNMFFDVIYEPLWGDGCITTKIYFSATYPPVLSTGCGAEIVPDEIHDSTIELNPSQPNMEVLFSNTFDLTKKKAQGWMGTGSKKQTITAYVWLSNVTKLYEVKVKIRWNTSLLEIDEQQIFINEEKFPMPWVKLELKITHDTGLDEIEFTIARPNRTEKYLKGTFWLLKLDFKVKCYNDTYGLPVNASTDIKPVDGYMKMDAHTYTPTGVKYNFTTSYSTYFWTPIFGDFDQNGHVGVEDIMFMFDLYGPVTHGCSFDFDGDDDVDIFDVVPVAKLYCTDKPPVMSDP